MRDDQVRRYARHILVPDVGGLGQTALLVARARVDVHENEPDAELIAAMFLAAGGVGTLAIRGANHAQLEQVGARGPDTTIVPDGQAPISVRQPEDVALPPKPAWWPSTADDSLALAYWRGSIAATRWMAAIANA